MNKITEFLITLFLGPLGIHKFIQKKYGLGFLYLITGGLFYIGWIYDSVKAFINIFKNEKKQVNLTNKNSDITYNVDTLNNSIPNQFTEQAIFNEIRIIKDSTYLIDHSLNIDTVMSRLDFIADHILYLKDAENKGLYSIKPTAKEYYHDYLLLRDKKIQQAIVRCYEKELENLSKLKTEKGRMNRLNKFFDKLRSYIPMQSQAMQTYIENFISTRESVFKNEDMFTDITSSNH